MSTLETVQPPGSVADVDDTWLAAALGLDEVTCVDKKPVGGGHLADTYLLSLDGAPWPQLLLKVTSADAHSRDLAANGGYANEVSFYRDLAAELQVRVPACYWAGHDPGTGHYAVLLEFVDDAVVGDQVIGCSPQEAARVLDELALLHGRAWGDESLRRLTWLLRHNAAHHAAQIQRARDGLPTFLAAFGERLSPEVVELAIRFVGMMERHDRRGQAGPQTLVHGDVRAENLLFGPDRACLIDWGTALLGHGLGDVSYFLGTSMTLDDRRTNEEVLLRRYHARLVDQGVAMTWADCWTAYRRFAFEGLWMTVVVAAALTHRAGADDMLLAMTERAGRHVLDLDAEQLLAPG